MWNGHQPFKYTDWTSLSYYLRLQLDAFLSRTSWRNPSWPAKMAASVKESQVLRFNAANTMNTRHLKRKQEISWNHTNLMAGNVDAEWCWNVQSGTMFDALDAHFGMCCVPIRLRIIYSRIMRNHATLLSSLETSLLHSDFCNLWVSQTNEPAWEQRWYRAPAVGIVCHSRKQHRLKKKTWEAELNGWSVLIGAMARHVSYAGIFPLTQHTAPATLIAPFYVCLCVYVTLWGFRPYFGGGAARLLWKFSGLVWAKTGQQCCRAGWILPVRPSEI